MVSARGTTKTKRVLLGRSGSEESFAQLADGLRSEGFRVVEEKSSPVGAHSTGEAINDVLRGIDVVLLVVHKNDGLAGPAPAFERVLHDADVIQQSIGAGKVVLLVEESVDGLPDTDLTHIRFPTSRADMILQDVVKKLGTIEDAPRRDLHARIPMAEQAMSSALRVPWLLVLVVLVSAAIPLALALNALWGDDDEAAPEATADATTDVTTEVTTIAGVAGALRVEGAQAGSPADGSQAPAAEGAASETDAQSSIDSPAAPAAPRVTLPGSNTLLPATCEVDLRKGSLLDDAVICTQAGRLVIEGLEGPWHNETAAVAVDEGVVGELYYELRDNGTTVGPSVIELAGGSVVLNPADAAYGIEKLIVSFSAQGQHVHLFRSPDGRGDFVTLTFTLDGG